MSPAEAPAKAPIKLPALTLRDQTGQARPLHDFHGRYLVLYFYPKDATPGCTVEARGFRDAYAQLQQAAAEVVGVSTDDVASHARFAKEESLPFPLLADEKGVLAKALGVGVTVGFASRETFLFAPDGTLVRHYETVNPAGHAADLLSALKAHRSASQAP